MQNISIAIRCVFIRHKTAFEITCMVQLLAKKYGQNSQTTLTKFYKILITVKVLLISGIHQFKE